MNHADVNNHDDSDGCLMDTTDPVSGHGNHFDNGITEFCNDGDDHIKKIRDEKDGI